MENELLKILSADKKFNITLRNYETYQDVGDLFNKVRDNDFNVLFHKITFINFKTNCFEVLEILIQKFLISLSKRV